VLPGPRDEVPSSRVGDGRSGRGIKPAGGSHAVRQIRVCKILGDFRQQPGDLNVLWTFIQTLAASHASGGVAGLAIGEFAAQAKRVPELALFQGAKHLHFVVLFETHRDHHAGWARHAVGSLVASLTRSR
jgi:hypothetical protein